MKSQPPLDADIVKTVQQALNEDIGSGDINAQLIAVDKQATAQVISRQAAILCGIAWFNEVFKQLDNRIQITWYVEDGDILTPNQRLCVLTGTARPLLTGERTALNFLQLLSSTATQAYRCVQTIAGTRARILDTRKTLPGLRSAQKYAVRCGGGNNHRMGLYDAFLIKENHIFAAGSITKAVIAARQIAPQSLIEVEVENSEQLREALQIGVERILLDNFSLTRLRDAVQMVNGKASLEASGGITFDTLREIAETGVDYISVGAMTKNVEAVDLSMRIII